MAGLMRAARDALAVLAIATTVAGCGVALPGGVSLPKEFPADFPIPPSAKLVAATGPLPFGPAEIRGMTAQWTSTLSKDDLASFYGRPHGSWSPARSGVEGPSAGPITLGKLFLLTHVADGMTASVSVGMTNTYDSGTLVQATIVPARSSPRPAAP